MACAVGGQLGRRFGDAVHKALFKGFIGVHPSGGGHHIGGIVAGYADAGAVHIEDALLAGAKDCFRFIHIALIAVGNRAGVVDHEQTAGRHFQTISCHRHNRCGRSCCAGDSDLHAARIGADIIEHPGCGITGAAIAVQTNVDIIHCGIVFAVQPVMQAAGSDFISEPAVIIDVAVHGNLPQLAFLLVRLLDLGLGSSGGGCSCTVSSAAGSSSSVDTADATIEMPASPTGIRLPLHR